MTQGWSELIGQSSVRAGFQAAISQRRLGGSYLFIGPPGTGKHTVVQLLAKTLLCRLSDPQEMTPCGHCEACQQVVAGSHPDILRVQKPKDKTVIPVASFIGEPDNRMREGFCHDLRIRPLMGGWKVGVIDDADCLNEEGANCLLKTLEEPPSKTVVILIGTSEQRQLPTIRSRCQTVRLGPLSRDDSCKLLRDVHGVQQGDEILHEAVQISGGDIHAAVRLLEGESGAVRDGLLKLLQDRAPNPVEIAKFFNQQVSEVGKDASKRRAMLRDLFSISVQHFRQRMRSEVFAGRLQHVTGNRLDRSLRAIRELDRSANQATLIECFASDIASGETGDRGEIG
ncbi:MAG: AAA family ATPase [Rubripirellula sp.]|nr:AAA family ATPase [Rubripirellula sp.]